MKILFSKTENFTKPVMQLFEDNQSIGEDGKPTFHGWLSGLATPMSNALYHLGHRDIRVDGFCAHIQGTGYTGYGVWIRTRNPGEGIYSIPSKEDASAARIFDKFMAEIYVPPSLPSFAEYERVYASPETPKPVSGVVEASKPSR